MYYMIIHETQPIKKRLEDYAVPRIVLGPALAMDNTPGPVCLSLKFSSGNFVP